MLESGTAAGMFTLKGRLDFQTVPDLAKQARLLFGDGKTIAVDLSGVTHSNSAGLALLLEWVRTSRVEQRRFSFQNIPEKLLSIARVTEVDDFIVQGTGRNPGAD